MAPDISTRSEKGLWVCNIHVAGTVMVEAACQKKKESIEEACSMLVSMIKEDVMEAAPTRDGRMDDGAPTSAVAPATRGSLMAERSAAPSRMRKPVDMEDG
jgi:hypothetical protein